MPKHRPIFTVLVPTHSHHLLLPLALGSLAQQSLRDFEVFIIGDGATKETEDATKKFCQDDTRFTWFKFPKSPRTGEIYRHELITQRAGGRYIAYLADDDLWHPDHLLHMFKKLEHHDFVGARYVSFDAHGSISVRIQATAEPNDRNHILRGENYLPLSTVAHTKKAYLELPFGWRSTPKDTATDLFMWQQWFGQSEFSFADLDQYTVLNFPSPQRKSWPEMKRHAEMQHWFAALSQTEVWLELYQNITLYLHSIIYNLKTEPEIERLRRYEAEDKLQKLLDSKTLRAYHSAKKLLSRTKL